MPGLAGLVAGPVLLTGVTVEHSVAARNIAVLVGRPAGLAAAGMFGLKLADFEVVLIAWPVRARPVAAFVVVRAETAARAGSVAAFVVVRAGTAVRVLLVELLALSGVEARSGCLNVEPPVIAVSGVRSGGQARPVRLPILPFRHLQKEYPILFCLQIVPYRILKNVRSLLCHKLQECQ